MISLILKNKKVKNSIPVLYRSGYHWVSYIRPVSYTIVGFIGFPAFYIFSGSFQVLAFFLMLLFQKGVSEIFKNRSMKIWVTERFIIVTTGVFFKRVNEMPIDQIEGIGVFQNWISRRLGYGTISFSIGESIYTGAVSRPAVLREEIIKQKNKLKTLI